ncbi:hydroxyacyl-coenzyme A dehydrogenase, mitochondrial-like [Paramacrobiotus metropolitanus]|uniref:hydroxyacyl-coenzyme A dehydrogenase, mitochondrial-like n=1 Tax=Paramacrobiotus metropolitanus TaxID=2943436 RepID=UPI00244658B6|nr:hydroxyacyl-coenzyme A dehydrogenase, mitochondrial-like [Paramacrobiotus metropolitanus]
MFSHRSAQFFRLYSTSNGKSIRDVVVIGAGLMGGGIAQVTAAAGLNVTLVDHSQDALVRARNSMAYRYHRKLAKELPDNQQKAKEMVAQLLQHVQLQTDHCEAASQADLVIEAVVENIQVKKLLFQELDRTAAKHTIFASNTSSLSITEMADGTERKDRFVGMHFFSPVPVMPLVELTRLDSTNDAVYDCVKEFVKTIGKTSVDCKDTPGFIVNRLLIPYMLEAVRMLERGDAEAKDIDTAMKLGAGYKIGPLELMDFIGLDVAFLIIQGWHKKMPNDPLFAPVRTIQRMVEEGRLGRKSGSGFYEYKAEQSVDADAQIEKLRLIKSRT